MSEAILSAHHVTYRINSKFLVHNISLDIQQGEFLVIVGANGAGKTTLMRLMAGDLTPSSGSVTLMNTPIHHYSMKELARQRAVMPQKPTIAFDFSVYDVVMMGRYPHVRTSQSQHDREVVESVLERTQAQHLRHQSFSTLSGGEQARVTFARVLAQQTPILMLDEPTSALDLRHQQLALSIAHELVQQGNTVIAILHDLNLAAMYADRIAMLVTGELKYLGTPTEVLTPANIQDVFHLSVQIMKHPTQEVPLIVPLRA